MDHGCRVAVQATHTLIQEAHGLCFHRIWHGARRGRDTRPCMPAGNRLAHVCLCADVRVSVQFLAYKHVYVRVCICIYAPVHACISCVCMRVCVRMQCACRV